MTDTHTDSRPAIPLTGADIESRMLEAEAMVGNARGIIARGEPLDLTQLGDSLSQLSEDITANLGQIGDREAIITRLQKILKDLNGLERDLQLRWNPAQ